MALNIKPIGDRVVVEAAPAEEKTASGIYIPDTAKEKPSQGTIVAVGTVITCCMANTQVQRLLMRVRNI
jgi:co-chaperonin GroES (HSP10)